MQQSFLERKPDPRYITLVTRSKVTNGSVKLIRVVSLTVADDKIFRMASKRLGKIAVKSSGLFLCDMQEKFRNAIQYYPQILNVSARMLQAARTLEMPIVVTEQYPKGDCSKVNKK